MEKYFNNLLPGGRVFQPGGAVVDLRFGVPTHSLELYCNGFQYLSLKPAAKDLFVKLSKEKLEALIKLKETEKRVSDVKILKEILFGKNNKKNKKIDR